MVRMPASERRAQAREAARSLLRTGVTADTLTLRSVAQELEIPLPTLTYVYGSVAQLLSDLRTEFEARVAAAQADVGRGGLVTELQHMVEMYLDVLAADSANIEILRWQFLLVGKAEIIVSGGLTMSGCLRRIQQNSGEEWGLPLEDLSVLAQSMISGMHLQFFVRGADEVALSAWRQDGRLMADYLGRLAAVQG